MKKKKGIIVLSIVLVLVIGIGLLLWSQINNLNAIKYARYSEEERESFLIQNQQEIDKTIEELEIEPLNPLTKEQEEMLQRGELSEKEALQIIMGNVAGEPQKPGSALPGGIGKEKKEKESGSGSRVQELIARVYLLRSSFTGQLDSLVAQAKAEYVSQKKATGKADKATIAARYIGRGTALESACDGQMEAILSEISAELKRIDGDMSLVGQIRSTYNAEKSIKKAALLHDYAN